MLLRHQLLKLMLCALVLCFEWMSLEASSNPTPHETNGNRAERLHAWSQPQDYPRLVSDWNKDWSMDSGPGAASLGGSQAKCIAIPANMTLCHGAGYSEMRLPNLLDHESLETASRQTESWVPLLNIRCHPDTQVFLCSLFAPVCLDHPIWPCRSLCQAIQTGCEPLMLRYGFPWPEMLSCEKFPIDNDLCVGIQYHLRPLPPQGETTCAVCEQPETYESIVDHFCRSDVVMRLNIDRTVVSGYDLKLITSKKKILKPNNLRKVGQDLRKTTIYIKDSSKCKCRHFWNMTSQSPAVSRAKTTYLVMGMMHNITEYIEVSFLQPIQPSSRAMARALIELRNNRICSQGIKRLLQQINSRDNATRPKRQKNKQKSSKSMKGKKLEGTATTVK